MEFVNLYEVIVVQEDKNTIRFHHPIDGGSCIRQTPTGKC